MLRPAKPRVDAAARGDVLRNEGVPALPDLRPEGVRTPASAPASPTLTPSLAIPPTGVEDPSIPEDEDGGRASRRPGVLLLFLAGVASGDGVAGGRVEALLDPLEGVERCRERRLVGDALLLELDEGLPVTISSRRGDTVPLSANNGQKHIRSAIELYQMVCEVNRSALMCGRLYGTF